MNEFGAKRKVQEENKSEDISELYITDRISQPPKVAGFENMGLQNVITGTDYNMKSHTVSPKEYEEATFDIRKDMMKSAGSE